MSKDTKTNRNCVHAIASTGNAGSPRLKTAQSATLKRHKYVAFHEAGHAVAAYYYGKLTLVTIDAIDANRLGTTLSCCLVAGVDLVGIAAQARYQRVAPSKCYAGSGRDDLANVESDATCVASLFEYVMSKEEIIDEWLKHAKTFVRDKWPAINAVADALMKKATLEGEEVGRIIATAMKEKYSPRPAIEIVEQMRTRAQTSGCMTIAGPVQGCGE